MDLQLLIQLGILVVLAGILVTLIRILDLFKKGHFFAENKTLLSIANHISWLANAVGVKNPKNDSHPATAMRDMADADGEGVQDEGETVSGGGTKPIGRPKNYVSVEVIDPEEAV